MTIAALLIVAAQLLPRLGARPLGYTAIGLAAFASWAGFPGPGEAALVAGAALAVRHRLDIVQVELFAFGGAAVGGMLGWALGWRFGALAARPGPLHRLRRRGLRAGERFYARFGPLAVFLTPSWVAGIHRVPPVRYAIFNLLSCAVWVAGYGLTTYYAGPRVADLFGDVGTYGTLAVVALALGAGTLAIVRWRRHHQS